MAFDLDIACHLNVLVAGASADELTSALDALVAVGYRRVVLPPLDPETTDASRLRSILAERGVSPITIASQAPGADVSSADADERAAGATLLRRAVDFTVELGGDQLNGVSYGLFGHPTAALSREAFERSAIEVGKVADYAHEHGIVMTFEVVNRYETAAINTAAQAMQYAEASGSRHLWIHLDTFHMAVEESDLAAAVRLALPRLRYLELGQSGRGALSDGAVDIEGLVRDALDDGYEGRWGVEAFSRAVIAPEAAEMLAIWRAPFHDGTEVAIDALRVIRKGWSASNVGRRAARLSSSATTAS